MAPKSKSEEVEHPISFQEFSRSLVRTEDEVWIGLLRNTSVDMKLTRQGWRDRLQSLKS